MAKRSYTLVKGDLVKRTKSDKLAALLLKNGWLLK